MRDHCIRALASAVIVAAVILTATTPARASFAGDPGWLYGDKETVGQAQGILQHLGLLKSGSYKQGTVDPATGAALVEFQRSHNLRQTGTLDWETMNQLLPHRPGRDGDGDGVVDTRDKCPGTPSGAKVDARGCPADSDGDGVADGLDRCPDTPRAVVVDREGCPVDSDRDGVFDGPDRCPDTPRGAKVDRDGCPVDSDGDGVPDGIDKCAGTPRGTQVNADGCPVEAPKPAVFAPGEKSLVLEGVTFGTSSARLTPESHASLDRVAESLAANPDVRVEVGGHTDNKGTAAFNTRLSKERAKAVVDYLVGKGIAASRLKWEGYGPARPVADNGTAEGRALNRRVELKQID